MSYVQFPTLLTTLAVRWGWSALGDGDEALQVNVGESRVNIRGRIDMHLLEVPNKLGETVLPRCSPVSSTLIQHRKSIPTDKPNVFLLTQRNVAYVRMQPVMNWPWQFCRLATKCLRTNLRSKWNEWPLKLLVSKPVLALDSPLSNLDKSFIW